MILGNKLSIEFRSTSNQSKNQAKAFRGGRAGGFTSNNQRGGGDADEASLRWGMRIIIRPIFGDPQLLYKNAINVSAFV